MKKYKLGIHDPKKFKASNYELKQGGTTVAVISNDVDNALGVVEGLVKVLNEQDKYVLPTKNYGGGYIRELTSAEKARQKALMEHRELLDE